MESNLYSVKFLILLHILLSPINKAVSVEFWDDFNTTLNEQYHYMYDYDEKLFPEYGAEFESSENATNLEDNVSVPIEDARRADYASFISLSDYEDQPPSSPANKKTTAATPTEETDLEEQVRQYRLFKGDSLPKNSIPLLNRKIFKGTRVTIREHPYIVNIRRKESHYLVGTLISRNVVVTVAHPLVDVPVPDLTVITGENYSDRGSNALSVILALVHEKFDPQTLSSDIAILRVYEEMILGTSSKTISLVMISNFNLNGRNAFVTGWGRCDFTGSELCLPRSSVYYPQEFVDPMLRTVYFPIQLPNPACKGYDWHGIPIPNDTICIGVAREKDPMTPCMAVPGAPLVVDGLLLGMQTWGFGCGYQRDMPIMYTDLRKHISWLSYNLNILRHASKSDLKELFISTRAYVLMQWLLKTRVYTPPEHKHQESNYQPLAVDRVLSHLSSVPIDVRDSIENKTFQEPKRRFYKWFQSKFQYMQKIQNISNLINAVPIKYHAFLNKMGSFVLNFDKRTKPQNVEDDDEMSEYESFEYFKAFEETNNKTSEDSKYQAVDVDDY